MSQPFLGQIMIFAGNFAPVGWAFCNGQLLSINQNTALFSLLGTTYGGNGVNTFALPDLRGRVPVHFGQGLGLSPYTQGEIAGTETVTLTQNNLPAHNHLLNAVSGAGTAGAPGPGEFLAQSTARDRIYSNAPTPDTTLSTATIAPTGGGQPADIRQPYLVMNFVIALQGVFPSRN